MKLYMLLFTLPFSGMVNGQTTQSAIGISYESSGGTDFISDYWNSFYDQFEVLNSRNTGLTVFYDHFYHFKGRAAISYGLGFNMTVFNHSMTFQNSAIPGFNPNPEVQSFSHSNYFLALDLPFRYYLKFKVKERLKLMPYLGIKIRNVLYIGDEGRNTTVGGGTSMLSDSGTTINNMHFNINYNTTESRVLFHPHIGGQVSYDLPSGKALNFFGDYNLSTIFNFVEIAYNDFSNTENQIYYSIPRTVRFMVKNAHLRFGVSYNW